MQIVNTVSNLLKLAINNAFPPKDNVTIAHNAIDVNAATSAHYRPETKSTQHDVMDLDK